MVAKSVELRQEAGLREPELLEQGGKVGARFSKRRQELMNALRGREACSLAQLVAAVGEDVTERTIQRDLSLMRKRGLVRLTGRGRGARYAATGGENE